MQEVLDIAVGVAVEVRRKCPYVSHEDLVQEAAEWALKNPTKLAEYMELDERDRNAVIAVALRNRMRRVAEQNKAAALGYRYRDLGWYSRAEIVGSAETKGLLHYVFDRASWVTPPVEVSDRVSGGSLPSQRGGWQTQLADVADAYRRLSRDDQDMIRLRFGEEQTLGRIADVFDLAVSTVHERLDRAVARLHRHLGGDRPVDEPDEISGGRRAVSNAQAQSMTAEGWNG